MRAPDRGVADEIASLARPLGSVDDLDPLIDRCRDARHVLLGEASHGTSEHYRWRAEITKRLIAEHGFSFVAVEGDWPDCFEVNRWVKGRDGAHRDAEHLLRGFDRWPAWMWANEEVAGFVTWLHERNAASGTSVGFYGLDLYSLWDSLRVVCDYLSEVDPDAVEAARRAFRCFDPYGEDPQSYAWATRFVPATCEDDVVRLLVEMRTKVNAVDGDPEAELDALQNAEVAAGAERFYRVMARGDGDSWNVRDCHMVDTLDRLMAHHGRDAKAIVWEHNTHIGDARATDMAHQGMVNVGQLVRERHGDDGVVLVGMGAHHGTVMAAGEWGDAAEVMDVPPPPDATHEALIDDAVGEPALFVFGDDRTGPWLSGRRGHRAIGVVYNPRSDHRGNWVPTVMGRRYDAFLSLRGTEAVHPLVIDTASPADELETYPTGT